MTSIALPSDGSTSSLRAHTFTDDPPPCANRSTGPRTPEGKARSSQNARKHNLAAATPPPDLNASPAYQSRLENLRKEWRAWTPTQELLVDQLALVMWKLEQIPRIERTLLATELDAETVATFPPTPPNLNLADCPDTSDADPTAAITAHHLQQNQPTPLTRLWDHHRRLLARCQSLIRQLQSLKRNSSPPSEPPANRARRETDKATLDQELARIH